MSDATKPDGTRPTGGAGQSAGGAYPNPHGPGDAKKDGPLGHGGQTEIDYSGPDDAKDNAATGKD